MLWNNGVEGEIFVAGIDQTVECALWAVVADAGRDWFLAAFNNDLALAGKDEDGLAGSVVAMPSDGCTGDKSAVDDLVVLVLIDISAELLLTAVEIRDDLQFHFFEIKYHSYSSSSVP